MDTLNTNGYSLRPGFVKNNLNEVVSPYTHTSTIYEGDKTLTEILDEVNKLKEEFPEVMIIDLAIPTDRWISNGSYFYYSYTNSKLPRTRYSEVRADNQNMALLVNSNVRWVIAEDTNSDSVNIYISKVPISTLYIKLVIYKNFIKIPLSITSWQNDNGLKKYTIIDYRIKPNKLGLLYIDKYNITKFLNNSFISINTLDEKAYIYTNKDVSLDCSLIIIDKSISYVNKLIPADIESDEPFPEPIPTH